MKALSRRQLLTVAGIAALGGAASTLPTSAQDDNRRGNARIFDVKLYGASGNGISLDTTPINRAITDCNSNGGGIVFFPPGTYLSGTVVLKSNVTLYLDAGATLLGSKMLIDYTPQSLDSSLSETKAFARDLTDTGSRHLIFAYKAENIGLTGPGKIDGQGPAFWVASGRKPPFPGDVWKDVAANDWKTLPRPSPMLEFYKCKNIRIEEVRIENAPGWTVRPILCDEVFIRGISVKNPVYGPNTDGIDLVCCRNVFISDCLIDTGDDAICLKSENPYGGEILPSQNITVTNCVLSGCCNGFKFGTASYGVFENIVFSNSVIFNDNVPLNSRIISGIALEMVDGGSIEGVQISNIRMQRVRTPIFIRLGNRHPGTSGCPGKLRGITIENIQATGSILTSSITGLPDFEVEDIRLSGVFIESGEGGKADWVERPIPDEATAYPEARMFGRLPSYGLFCRHVNGLRLQNVEFKTAIPEGRPAIFCDHTIDLEISGLRSAPIVGSQPVIKLRQTQQAFIRGCVAPAETKHYLEVNGDQTRHVVLMDNNLITAEKMMQAGQDVPERTVIVVGNAGGQI